RATQTASRSAVAGQSASAATTDSAEAVEAPAQSVSGNAIVDIAFRYVGTPYVYGGASPAGFDCSGFTWYVYQQAGISIPRSSSAQRNAGTVVSASEARPGDLVWWPGHVGIYLGDGQHIAARNPSKPRQAGPISDVGRGTPTFIRIGCPRTSTLLRARTVSVRARRTLEPPRRRVRRSTMDTNEWS